MVLKIRHPVYSRLIVLVQALNKAPECGELIARWYAWSTGVEREIDMACEEGLDRLWTGGYDLGCCVTSQLIMHVLLIWLYIHIVT